MRSYLSPVRRLASVLLLALLAAGAGGCQRELCSPPASSCPGEQGCVVGVCRDKDSAVVPAESRRVVLHATEVRVLAEHGAASDAVVALGAEGPGEARVLMRFDATLSEAAEVEGAFLVLDPERESPGPSAPVSVEVAPILAEWHPASASWGRMPVLGAPLARLTVPPARRAPLRFDVTEQVRRGVGAGLALAASGGDPVGARFVTRAQASDGPKLELYLSRRPGRGAAAQRPGAPEAGPRSSGAAP